MQRNLKKDHGEAKTTRSKDQVKKRLVRLNYKNVIIKKIWDNNLLKKGFFKVLYKSRINNFQ